MCRPGASRGAFRRLARRRRLHRHRRVLWRHHLNAARHLEQDNWAVRLCDAVSCYRRQVIAGQEELINFWQGVCCKCLGRQGRAAPAVTA